MTAPSLLLKSGSETVSGKLWLPLAGTVAAPQTFTTNVLCGVSSSSYTGGAGLLIPFSTTAITDSYIAYAAGRFDAGSLGAQGSTYGSVSPTYGQVVANTTDGAEAGAISNGVFLMANGTSGNAFAQANLGAVAYTADGQTANLTSSTNPLPVTGTGTGVPCGFFQGFDQKTGFPLISVVLSQTANFVALS